MQAVSIPPKFPKVWGQNADDPFIRPIPLDSQIGINAGFASLNDGFPPLTMTPIAAGGVPPFGQDVNGILKMITLIQQWQQAGMGWMFDSTFAAAIGGYPKGAVLNSAVVLGKQWMSTVDNNLTDPDSASAANWVQPPGQLPSGTPVPSFSPVVPNGFVAANGLTIGNATSGASGRANADTLFLYSAIWQLFSNAQCPLLNSAGAPIARGANPRADFAANNQLTVPVGKGASLVGVDGMGGSASAFLNGVPVVIGNATTPGSILGENLHAITQAELASHFHGAGISDPAHSHGTNATFITHADLTVSQVTFAAFDDQAAATIFAAATGVRVSSSNGLDTTGSTGGGAAHNTVQRSLTVYWNLAL
jgi:hypothetical protein